MDIVLPADDPLAVILGEAPLGAVPHAPALAAPVMSTGPSGQMSFAETVPAVSIPADPSDSIDDVQARPSVKESEPTLQAPSKDDVPEILFDLSHRVPVYLRVKGYSPSAAKVIARAARDHGEEVAKLVAEGCNEVIKLQEWLPEALKAARRQIEDLHKELNALRKK